MIHEVHRKYCSSFMAFNTAACNVLMTAIYTQLQARLVSQGNTTTSIFAATENGMKLMKQHELVSPAFTMCESCKVQ